MKNTIRQIYFYAATLIFLIMSVIAMISLLNLAMKTYVFKKADMAYNQKCDDLGNIYYDVRPMPVSEPMKDGLPAPKELTSEEKAARKSDCEANLADQKSAERQRDLVQYLSMLIVAGPLFWIHFKWVQKERETELKMGDGEKKV
jgi:hypothetical protein